MQDTLIGHNSADLTVTIEMRLFNTLSRCGGRAGCYQSRELAAGTTVGDLIAEIGIPISEIFLVLCNGRDITPGLYEAGSVNRNYVVNDGDVIAFSGPVPYSYGYGAPVV